MLKLVFPTQYLVNQLTLLGGGSGIKTVEISFSDTISCKLIDVF